jgi:hypothetical protein
VCLAVKNQIVKNYEKNTLPPTRTAHKVYKAHTNAYTRVTHTTDTLEREGGDLQRRGPNGHFDILVYLAVKNQIV